MSSQKRLNDIAHKVEQLRRQLESLEEIHRSQREQQDQEQQEQEQQEQDLFDLAIRESIRIAKEERRVREQEARRVREQEARRVREQEARRVREQEERRVREQEDRRAREQEDRRAREQEDRRVREQEERRVREQEDRRAREQEERRTREQRERDEGNGSFPNFYTYIPFTHDFGILNSDLCTTIKSSSRNNNCLLYSLVNAGILEEANISISKEILVQYGCAQTERSFLPDDSLSYLAELGYIPDDIAFVMCDTQDIVSTIRRNPRVPVKRVVVIKHSGAHYEYVKTSRESPSEFHTLFKREFMSSETIESIRKFME